MEFGTDYIIRLANVYHGRPWWRRWAYKAWLEVRFLRYRVIGCLERLKARI